MITLLHGDYIEASRNEYFRLKNLAGDREVRILDGRKLDDSELVQSLESTSLFGTTTIVFIERLFGKLGKQPKRIEALGKILTANASSDIVLWEDKEVGATVIKHLGSNVKNQQFKLPVVFFQFLDGLTPGNTSQLLTLFEKVCETNPPEVTLSMVVKRVRQLIQLSDGITPEGLAPWQANRLTSQAKSFTMEKLLDMYRELHDMEVSIKTGSAPFDLKSLVDQFIIHI